MPASTRNLPVALTIAGSDSGAGAGAQADMLTFAAHGVYATSALSCLTAQNPQAVRAVHAPQSDFLRAQIEQVFAYFAPAALKTGMLLNKENILCVADILATHPSTPAVVDPVMVATSGARLLEAEAVTAYEQNLFPLAGLITPNVDEAAVLLGQTPSHEDDLRTAAHTLATRYGTAVLLKGGHLGGDHLLDVLALPSGSEHLLRSERVHDIDTHGSGCTLSAAIAANLALGHSLVDAVTGAHAYLQRAMRHSLRCAGMTFINHFPPPAP